jgi:hypothetical protein
MQEYRSKEWTIEIKEKGKADIVVQYKAISSSTSFPPAITIK